jgi:hypothetical protein
MAVQQGYGKVAGADALVFAYDTGDTRNSYRGEPTTNLATLDLGNTSVWYNEDVATTTKELQLETLFGYPVYRIQSRPGSIWITPAAFNGYDKANGPITVSVYARNLGTTATLSTYLSGDFSTDSLGATNYKNIPTDGVWRRYSWTRTAADMNTGNQLEFRTSGTNIQISCPMVEHKLHPTQIVEGTRSATQGLLDLTGNSSVDLLTNQGYNSEAQIVFDGTNDHISGILPILGNGAPHTIEIVMSPLINQNAFGSRRDPFTIGNATTHQYSALDVSTSFMNWYFYSRDTTFTNSPLMVAGNYYHMVLSYAGGASNNTNKQVWYNGVKQTLSPGSSETSLLPDNPQFSIGRDIGRNTAYFPGEIPVFKVYDKALTEAEALSNFKHYKTRFGI